VDNKKENFYQLEVKGKISGGAIILSSL